MKREKTFKIAETTLDFLNRALNWKEGDSPTYRFNEDDGWVGTVVFDKKYEVDIKVCGVQYLGEGNDSAYSEVVLFRNGSEVCCSDVGDTVLGTWELSDGDTEFVVHVEVENV